jgi:hypothetical protein
VVVVGGGGGEPLATTWAQQVEGANVIFETAPSTDCSPESFNNSTTPELYSLRIENNTYLTYS